MEARELISRRRLDVARRAVLHGPLALGELPRPPAAELEEGVVAVDGHRHEAEEGGGAEGGRRGGVDGRVQGRREVEEAPERAEDHLDEHPGDDVELLDDVEEVEDEESAGRPEGRHGHEAEPVPHGLRPPVGSRRHHADEPDHVQYLEEFLMVKLAKYMRDTIRFHGVLKTRGPLKA